MTKSKCQRPKETQNPNGEDYPDDVGRVSDFFRHLSFGFRQLSHRRLAGQLDQSFSDTGNPGSIENKKTVPTIFGWSEPSETVRFNDDRAARGEAEVAAVRQDRIEHRGEVPGGAVVRRR